MRTLTLQETRATAGGTFSCLPLLSLFRFKLSLIHCAPKPSYCQPKPPSCGGGDSGSGGGNPPPPPLEIE